MLQLNVAYKILCTWIHNRDLWQFYIMLTTYIRNSCTSIKCVSRYLLSNKKSNNCTWSIVTFSNLKQTAENRKSGGKLSTSGQFMVDQKRDVGMTAQDGRAKMHGLTGIGASFQ